MNFEDVFETSDVKFLIDWNTLEVLRFHKSASKMNEGVTIMHAPVTVARGTSLEAAQAALRLLSGRAE